MTFSYFWVSYLIFRLSYPHRLIPLGITLAFSLPYPLCLICLGITLVFCLPYPYRLTSLGITLAFSPPIPILSHFSGYHACFFASHTHYVYLVKNCLRTNNSPSKKLGLLFQLFGIFSNMLNFQTSQLPISYSYP